MSTTIKDVAKAAGVSTSTVSRVINQKGVISEVTQNKILKIMEELDYVPNDTARSFANGSTSAIALVIDVVDARSYSNNFFNNSVFGIETVVHKNGYNLIITNGRLLNGDASSAEKLVFGKKVDGIILPISMVNKEFIGKMDDILFPYVILGEPRQYGIGSSWVDVNNIQGGGIAVRHLAEKGYRDIAFLSSGENKNFNQDRITGYCRALSENGLLMREGFIRHCGSTVENGMSAVSELFQQPEKPDAVICSDYCLAVGTLRAAAQHGLRVPQDLGIVCFDNTPVTELMEPSITAVDIDTFGLGEQAADILIQSIENKNMSSRQILISTKIIERDSTQRNRQEKRL